MRINTNVSSLVAQEAAVNTSKNLSVSLEKLSSGLRINKASDDASGLAIADKLRTQATSINQGISNGNSAVTLLQIADKSMAEQSNILDTIKSKLIQANTDTTSADGRESIRKDIKKLLEQLDNIAEQTNYNGNVLLQKSATDKSGSNSLNFQVGEKSKDIISNTAIQSNTEGLGSKTNYLKDTTLKSSNSILVTSDSTINIVGGNKQGSTVENVTLNGDVNELTLRSGATISNTNAATKALLKNVSSQDMSYDSIKDTFTVTAKTPLTIDLSTVDNVQATVITPNSDYLKPTNVTAGQVISVNSADLVSGSELNNKLNDTNLFTKLTGANSAAPIFVAISNTTINSLSTSGSIKESFKLITTTNVEMGTGPTQFNAGDTITVDNVVSGSLLQHALTDTNMFATAGAGKYIVKDTYTAGALRLMENESIKITQGKAAAIDGMSNALSTSGFYSEITAGKGLSIGSLFYNQATGAGFKTGATIYQATADFSKLQLNNSSETGSTVFGSGEDNISFTISATGMAAGDSSNFMYKKGDIITLQTDSVTGGTTDPGSLSRELMSSKNFVALSGGVYQALTDGSVTMDGTDEIDVKRLIGSTAEPVKISFDATKSELKEITTNDNSISLKTGSAITISNNDLTKGNNLNLTSNTDMTNGKESLMAIADLDTGELTASLSSSFQTIVDDAITKLNNYRGDIGSTQNQVESAVRNLMTQATNVKAAESIIRDVDYAAESANFNKQNIISQAGNYAISQSNSTQQNVLRLLQ